MVRDSSKLRASDGHSEGLEGDGAVYGGAVVDAFVFDPADKGSGRVRQLDVWDSVEFNGFGHANVSETISHMRTRAVTPGPENRALGPGFTPQDD